MQKADYLLRLMKQRTDALVASDKKLQHFLMWVGQKSLSVKVPYKLSALRAFYFAVDLGLDRAADFALDRAVDPTLNRAFDLAVDPALDMALALVLDQALDPALVGVHNLAFVKILVRAIVRALNHALVRALESPLRKALEELKEQLPDSDSDDERFKQWWQANGKAWTEQLRAMMIKYRNIGHDWQLSKEQREVLKQYYHANKLLVDCLNSGCNVTPEVREEIEETLLLPKALIEKRVTEMLPNAEG
jgi:predicted NACHT family NTPase